MFVGSPQGVYALDARSGCMYWTVKTPSGVGAAVSISADGQKATFAHNSGAVYAASTAKGEVKWKTQADPSPLARVTGAPVLAEDSLYVPMSSGEEGSAINPYYECCKFRGPLLRSMPRQAKLSGIPTRFRKSRSQSAKMRKALLPGVLRERPSGLLPRST